MNIGAVNIGFENVHNNKAIKRYDCGLSFLKFRKIILMISEKIKTKKNNPYFLKISKGAISIL